MHHNNYNFINSMIYHHLNHLPYDIPLKDSSFNFNKTNCECIMQHINLYDNETKTIIKAT
jgi:hypothetical protein